MYFSEKIKRRILKRLKIAKYAVIDTWSVPAIELIKAIDDVNKILLKSSKETWKIVEAILTAAAAITSILSWLGIKP